MPGEPSRRDALHSGIANNFSTTASLFISFLVAFVVVAETTSDVAWHVVVSLGLLIAALAFAVTGGALIYFDDEDKEQADPATACLCTCHVWSSAVLLAMSGALIFVALIIILPYIVCQQFDFTFSQGSIDLNFNSAVNSWPNSSDVYSAVQQDLARQEWDWSQRRCFAYLWAWAALALFVPLLIGVIACIVSRHHFHVCGMELCVKPKSLRPATSANSSASQPASSPIAEIPSEQSVSNSSPPLSERRAMEIEEKDEENVSRHRQ